MEKRKLYTTLTALLVLVTSISATAQELPAGVMSLGNEVSALEVGKWYFLYNHNTQKYVYENTNLALKQGSSPTGLSVSGNEGYLFCLEATETEGSFYLKTGRGNYVKGPATSGARGTGKTPTSAWLLTFPIIDNTAGHFLIQGANCVMVAPTNGGDPKGGTTLTLNGIGDWGFREVGTTDAGKLTGRDLYNYQMSRLSLFRLHNKRTSSAYLTSTAKGSAVGAAKSNDRFSQVWVATKTGSGYTLRSANTGEYLGASFGSPSESATTLYIQFSPNNKGTDAYINVSSASDFSGQTCLNLGNDGTTLYKWSYANDAGSDWAIDLVEDMTLDEIKEHLAGGSGFAAELTDGAYYRVYSPKYSRYMTEVDGNVASISLNADNFAQYWQLKKNGTGYTFQNVMSERYIQRQGSTSAKYQTGTSAVALYPRRTADEWNFVWVIANAAGGGVGLHTDAAHNVVNWWDLNTDGSFWQFEPVELSEEDIAAARGSMSAYTELVNNLSSYQKHLDNLFADKACTTLKANIQALSDDALKANADFVALNEDMKAMVLKVKNDTWKQYTNKTTGYTAGYEKFFRVADYKVYSHFQEMCNGSNFTMSNSFGKLSGPTGILANPDDIVCIYVDKTPSSDCTLQLEAVTTEGVPGNHQTGSTTALKQGLNVYRASQQVVLYIFYQLNNTQKYLADYPDIKIHIEGGQLNGYWDATRGMTNADWKLLQQDLLKASPVINLKTEHLVFCMNSDLVKQCEPNEMEGLMRIWDKIPENEERYMGVEDFAGRYRNIWNVFSIDYNYMFATTYGTYYNESTMPSIMNYANMRKAGSLWGPSHEMGHNHQASINVVGTTESSNNMFSNINTFEQGIQTTRRNLPPDVFADLATSTPWVGRNIWNTTSMFFQLYLYFHVMHHDDNFLPNLFRKMRQNPITTKSGWDSTTQFVDNGETKTGANTTYGKLDYLHLAKMICDVAQADLSEFFEAYGMFVPVEKYFVGDYANYLVTTTQADIDAAKKYMQKYPKKLGNIMFIDDHIGPMKDADPNNIFEAIPASSGKKSNNTSQRGNGGDNIGDVGDYEDFDDDPAYDVNSDYFTLSGNTITFKGTGYMGHKFYDKKGNLIWATNAKTATLPSAVKNLGVDNFTVVAAEANMGDVPCPYYKSGTAKLYKANVYFGNEKANKIWWTNGQTDMDACLPTNAMAVLEAEDTPANVLKGINVINTDGTAQRIVINGDAPCYIPVPAQAGSLKFTKAFDGYAALDLPFAVTTDDVEGLQTLSIVNDQLSISAAFGVEAGYPVVAKNGVAITQTNAKLTAGSYQELTDVTVLTADGQGVEKVATASPFTFTMEQVVGIRDIQPAALTPSISHNVYDLSGRRVSNVRKAGIYIVGGKKLIKK